MMIIGLALLLLVVAAVGVLVFRPPRQVVEVVAEQVPHTLFQVDTDVRAIALTIDDSPHPEVTPGILEVLRRHGARATFFVIGSHAERHPELIEAIRADGHELGNHLYLDRLSSALTDEEFTAALLRTDALIRPPGAVKWCRPGSGVITDRIAGLMEANGYRACLATAYPLDIRVPTTIARWQFLANVRPGAILVLHDGEARRKKTIRVLEKALPRLERRGYRVLTVSELAALEPAESEQ